MTRRLAALWVLLLVCAGPVRAQEWTIFDFESLQQSRAFWPNGWMSGADSRPVEEGGPYTDWFAVPDAQKGDSALMIEWRLYASESWGGSVQLQNYDSTGFYDFSDFTHIGIHYQSLVAPAERTLFRLKIHDASGATGTADADKPKVLPDAESWYSESPDVYQPVQPTWSAIEIPLEDLGQSGCCGSGGFHQPGWDGQPGNNTLDFDQLRGFTLEWNTATLSTADATVEGTVVWDNFYVRGERYNVVEAFDDLAARVAAGSIGQWGTGTSSLAFTDVPAAEAVQGEGAVEVAWSIDASESWGGGANFESTLAGGETHEDMSQRTHLSLFYDVVEAASTPGVVGLRVLLLENSEGQNEEWVFQTYGIYDEVTNGWTRLLMPLVGLPGGDPSDQGFVIPPWVGYKGNNQLDPDHVVGYRIEWTVPAEKAGTKTSGTIRFDRLTGYGWQETDFEAPAAVENISATVSDYANVVSWEDVPDETGETYDIYYSPRPIASLDGPHVYVAAQNVAEDTEVFVHDLYAPIQDQRVTYYYAVVATDRAGNKSTEAFGALAQPVENDARGTGAIALSAPPAFAADGSVSEWSGVTPIHIAPGSTFGYAPASTGLVTDAADASADIYVAAGDDALYVAFDVTDDRVTPVPAGTTDERWMWDGTELYIGFYDSRGARHNAYQTGAESDYKFQFYTEVARFDLAGGKDVAVAGDGNYAFEVKDNGLGYVIEARLPYEAFLFEGAPAFAPENGWMVPFDVVVMDNDSQTKSREGILTYSPFNNDNSWSSTMNWFWAYAGTELRPVSAGASDVPQQYALDQNYPNPFNPATVIGYTLPQTGRVTLSVYNVLGQQVAMLVDGVQTAGSYEVRFDASTLPSGVYLYTIEAGTFSQTRRMTLVR